MRSHAKRGVGAAFGVPAACTATALPPLHRALLLEPNPAGPKFALHLLDRASPEVRLPLVRVSDGFRTAVADHAPMCRLAIP
jgi:dihydrodipicolinate synthase/N-acetylneuraminate lyase